MSEEENYGKVAMSNMQEALISLQIIITVYLFKSIDWRNTFFNGLDRTLLTQKLPLMAINNNLLAFKLNSFKDKQINYLGTSQLKI